MQNLKAGHAGTASSGLNHNGLSQNGYGEGKFLSERRKRSTLRQGKLYTTRTATDQTA